MSVPESRELVVYDFKRRLQDEVRRRASGRRSTRSLTLDEVDQQLIANGFGWVIDELNGR